MRQLVQNDPEHNQNIQDEGCKYITALNFYQDITQHQITSELVNAVYVQSQRSYTIDTKGKEIPYMSKTCFVNNISGIIQLVSAFTGIEVHMKEVSKNEKHNYRMAYFTRTTDIGRKFVGHFVWVALDSDKVLADPWLGGSKTARIGTIASYRYVKARLL